MLRQLGFAHVYEVAFGADLVARGLPRASRGEPRTPLHRDHLPAIVGYVERYHPGLASLAPVVSPMVATARVARSLHGRGPRIVFIGPCIAKKGECAEKALEGEIDAVLTFAELREMLTTRHITPETAETSEFDAPHARLAGLFPISRGMLQAAGISEDLVAGQVVAADGRIGVRRGDQGVRGRRHGRQAARGPRCNGCIMGAGMTTESALFSRRSGVSQYVRRRMAELDEAKWRRDVEKFSTIDLSRRLRDEGPARRRSRTRTTWRLCLRRWASSGRKTSSTAGPAATTRAASTRWRSTRGWPRARCACPTPSTS